jgi:hypothetical protein
MLGRLGAARITTQIHGQASTFAAMENADLPSFAL